MFENALNELIEDYHNLLERMEKGKQMIDALPDKSGETYKSYVNQYSYLKVLAQRAYICIDILNGDVTLIAEQAGNLIVVKRVDDKFERLIEEARKLGGFVTELDAVERK